MVYNLASGTSGPFPTPTIARVQTTDGCSAANVSVSQQLVIIGGNFDEKSDGQESLLFIVSHFQLLS